MRMFAKQLDEIIIDFLFKQYNDLNMDIEGQRNRLNPAFKLRFIKKNRKLINGLREKLMQNKQFLRNVYTQTFVDTLEDKPVNFEAIQNAQAQLPKNTAISAVSSPPDKNPSMSMSLSGNHLEASKKPALEPLNTRVIIDASSKAKSTTHKHTGSVSEFAFSEQSGPVLSKKNIVLPKITGVAKSVTSIGFDTKQEVPKLATLPMNNYPIANIISFPTVSVFSFF